MLSEETIENFKDMLEGNSFSLNKCNHKETVEIGDKLYNFGFLTKDRNGYSVKREDRKYIKKLIELDSWNKFKDWLDEKEESGNTAITNNIHNSSVGQINQAIGGSTIKNSESKTEESSKNSWLNRLYWVIGIIGVVIGAIIALYQIFRDQ